MNSFGFNNQNMLNQLFRQKDNIENLINQYSQPQAPVQNIINTSNSTDFEARILKENEQIENILINKRTMFLDETNKKLTIKELDGTISKEYEIVIPLDEKDLRIESLEKELERLKKDIKNMEKNAQQQKSIEQKEKQNVNEISK